MRNAVLVHGKPGREEYYDPVQPSASNAHWFPWVQNQLLVRDIPAATPEMPFAFCPDYTIWRREFERFDIGNDTGLVGHSCGGGFLVRWLSEHPDVTVGRVVLVAPWLDPDRRETTDFFAFSLDECLAERTAGLVLFASDDDSADVARSVTVLREALPGLTYREFAGRGHFCRGDLGTDAFPELLETLLADVPQAAPGAAGSR